MTNFKLVNNSSDLEKCISQLLESRIIACDTETSSLEPRDGKLRLIQLSDNKNIFVIDCFQFDNYEKLKPLGKVLENPNIVSVWHNLKFDFKWIFEKIGLHPIKVFDTMLAELLVDYPQKNERGAGKLLSITKKYLNIDLDKEEQRSDWTGSLSATQLQYAATDVLHLHKLREILLQKIIDTDQTEVAKLEFNCISSVSKMELAGFPVDPIQYRKLLAGVEEERIECAKKLRTILGVREPDTFFQESLFGESSQVAVTEELNLRSQQQILKAFRGLGIDIDSTEAKVIEPLVKKYPKLQFLLDFRKVEKLLSTYGENFLDFIDKKTGRIHANYHQLGTETGRFSSSKPNLQNLPAEIRFRECFKPSDPNRIFCISDVSMFELRILAELSGDKIMLNAFQNGTDLHSLTASKIFSLPLDEVKNKYKEKRKAAKVCFSGDTEILTKNGWTQLQNYNGKTEIAQFHLPHEFVYNPTRAKSNRWGRGTGRKFYRGGGFIDFIKPIDYQKVPEQKLYHQKDRNTDLLMTGNHEVIYIDPNFHPKKLPALEINPGNISYIPCAGKLTIQNYKLSELETRLLAMIIADGSFTKYAISPAIKLGFTKQRKIERCRELLLQYSEVEPEFKYTENMDIKVPCFYIQGLPNKKWISKILEYTDFEKNLSWEGLFDLNPGVFLEESAFWDGSFVNPKNTTCRKRIRFCSIKEQTVDVMQAMCVISGIQSRKSSGSTSKCKKYYTLSYRLDDKYARHAVSWNLKNTEKISDVYCVQVPSGAIVVRRNGKVCISGNCNFSVAYGISSNALVSRLSGQGLYYSDKEAKNLISGFYETYPEAAKWLFQQEEEAIKNKCVRSLSNRLMKFDFDPKDHGQVGAIKRNGRNFRIQGTNADAIKLVLPNLNDKLGNYPTAKTVNTIHDEVIVECDRKDAPEINIILEQEMLKAAYTYIKTVPMKSDSAICENWGEKE